MRKRLILTIIVLGMLGGGGYTAYSYAMNVIADKIANQLVVDSGTSQQWLNSMDLSAIADTIEIPPSATPSAENPKSSTENKSNGSVVPKNSEGQVNASNTVMGQEPTTGNEQKKSTATEKKEAVQFENKQEAVKFVMSRFSASELNKLRQMASGGLTPEKKAELKKIAYTKFTSAEIAAVQRVVSSQ
ncbi:hypothetical protein PAECIP111891_06865 [Paenibacillus allorhizoplanae]|uniref:Uncharacterized protein n=1 Tax=Paenibacillus allorhizoplanae TaxID=2905648 RepID=A0ABM9D0Q8_9BACL|nr:hypothetical protein [Paenibacillus allorhizoplanae]CAH1231696.1 hypothetical protein PAECIP111891_06865 [Paenibacillus allorhizoplanae]